MDSTVVLLGLLAGLGFGTSDFFGGLAARRAPSALAVVALFQLVTVAMFAAAVFVAGAPTSDAALAWGAVAGVALGVGYIAYFQALAIGPMGVVSTVTAVGSAAVPVVAGVALGERPSAAAWIGIAVIVAAIPLVAGTRRRPATPGHGSGHVTTAGVVGGAVAGVAFGGFFVALDRASAAGPAGAAGAASELTWPLLAAAVGSSVVVWLGVAARRSPWVGTLAQWPLVIAAGAIYAVGTWAFAIGTSRGFVSIMAVIAALSPIPTMLLARVVAREALARSQYLGVVLGVVGVALLGLTV